MIKGYVEDDIIGIPEANITVFNLSLKTIEALELKFNYYDSFGRPVKWYNVGSNEFNRIA
ncbi:hypothetical protein [Anaerocellum danielii]|uniref:Uncharacterized protein n=1 Tax=Anaerocellum danielii TaxID=1387557 RepID=A0ABZ0U019_9FIRM|nr:hypothetical protein [Caldicellulosiruptor danielii]WPX08073.1 hypothetical protein SOJ16_001927 [Caldicellulosiruptor danielii]